MGTDELSCQLSAISRQPTVGLIALSS